MNRIFALFLISAALLAQSCQSDKQKLQQEIAQMETQLEAASSTELANNLIDKYLAYVAAYPEDADTDARFLYRAAGVNYRQGRYQMAADLLEQALKDYYASENTPASALLLGTILKENLKKTEAATTVFQSIKQAFPGFEEAKTETDQLDPSLPAISQRMGALLQQLSSDSLGRVNFQAANDYILNCEMLAVVQPNAEESPQLLYKAGEVAGSIGAYEKAIDLFDWIYNKYPDYEKAPLALFMKAFTLDNNMKNIDAARPVYEEFLAKYPDNDFARDAKILLENLGKSDEEIFNSFTKGAQEGETE